MGLAGEVYGGDDDFVVSDAGVLSGVMALEPGPLLCGEEAAAGFEGFQGVLGLEEGVGFAETGAFGFYEGFVGGLYWATARQS